MKYDSYHHDLSYDLSPPHSDSTLNVDKGHDLKDGGDRYGHDPKFGGDIAQQLRKVTT